MLQNAVAEQLVKLRSVALKPCAFVEDFAESFLNKGYVVANTDFAANFFLNIRGR